MSGGHSTTTIPNGAKRFLLPLAVLVLLALFDETNTKIFHALPSDLLTRDEVRLTSRPKLVGEAYTVTRVVDGDTLVVSLGTSTEKVRLLGINTPETVDPRRPVQCFGKEASARMKSLASGQMVHLETDSTQGERDKYGRILAYVYLNDGQMLNRKMIAEGYAYEYTYLHPYKYQQDFKETLAFARNTKVGLWADGVCEGK